MECFYILYPVEVGVSSWLLSNYGIITNCCLCLDYYYSNCIYLATVNFPSVTSVSDVDEWITCG